MITFMGWRYERWYGQVGYLTNVGPHLHVNRPQVSPYLTDNNTLSIAASSLNNVFPCNVKKKEKELHEWNGMRFNMIITSKQRMAKEQHSGVQMISHSYLGTGDVAAVNLQRSCGLLLLFLPGWFTQKIKTNKLLLKVDTADTWSLKYVVIRYSAALVALCIFHVEKRVSLLQN